jgi:S1-C subfamily serine protease
MRKPALYSPSRRPPIAAPAASAAPAEPVAVPEAPLPLAQPVSARWWADPRWLWAAMVLMAGLLIASQWGLLRTTPPALSQKTIDAAVLRSLSTQKLPSQVARAAEKIRPSVVRVVSFALNKKGEPVESGVGTGVVIVDKGVILTNLHVVKGAHSVRLVYADGSTSVATVTGAQPENDLAVLQAQTVPDDLIAATLRGTGDLVPGDHVVAVGFPFGIGPSTSSGVISGLGRTFRSGDGESDIGNLIQFDAAANPGNSGGPLVTMDGEVIGVVTGILNPTNHRTFLGIGFAVPIESAAAAAGLPPF